MPGIYCKYVWKTIVFCDGCLSKLTHIFSACQWLSKFISSYSGKKRTHGLHLYLNPNRNWLKEWDSRNRKRTQHQAMSLLKPNESSEWCVSHRTSHSDRDSEWESPTVKRASCPWAFHDMTLSRSRLLILSDLSLKSCNRVVTVKNSQGRVREPLKDDCLQCCLNTFLQHWKHVLIWQHAWSLHNRSQPSSLQTHLFTCFCHLLSYINSLET